MTQGDVMQIAQEALKVILLLCAPILGLSLIVGLAVSIFQATTQIQEQTLSFIPKILAVVISILIFGAWMLQVLIEYTTRLFLSMQNFCK